MIQRVQTIYLLLSITVCAVLLYFPMGIIVGESDLTYFINGFAGTDQSEMIEYNYPLIVIFGSILLLQAMAIFDFKNRKRQVIFVQISLVLLVALVVGIMMLPDFTGLPVPQSEEEVVLDLTWNIFLIVIPWILTYLAIRAIKKDDALIRSADRMR